MPISDDQTSDTPAAFASLAATLGTSTGQPIPLLMAETIEFGRYELLNLIGRGGFGEVFRALDRSTWKIVAIKKLLDERRSDADAQRRFELEIRVGKQLRDEHILRVLDDGQVNGARFFTVPYISGLNYLHSIGRTAQPVTDTLWIIRTIAKSVHVAHASGYVHCDIKPENILIESSTGRPFLTDFGLAADLSATTTKALTVVGTQPYMPPEQIDPHLGITFAAADIYGLGVTFYQALTGQTPFPRGGLKARELRSQIKWDRPLPPSTLNPEVPPDLDRVCLICLEKSPYDRYESASELMGDLDRVLAGQPIKGRLPSRSKRLYRRIRRQPVVAAGIVLSVFVGISTTLIATHFAEEASTIGEQLEQVQPTIDRAETRARQAEGREGEQEHLANMQEVQRLWDSGNLLELGKILDRAVPAEGYADDRGFEWYFWKERLKTASNRLSIDGNPRGIALSGDGISVMAVSDSHAEAWDTQTHQLLFKAEVGPGKLRGYLHAEQPGTSPQRAAISRDGSFFAATYPGDAGGSLVVWSRSGNKIFSVRGDHRLSGHAVVFSPDGRHVVAGSYGGRWVAWLVETGTEDQPTTRCFTGCGFVNPEMRPTETLWFASSDELHAFSPGLTLWSWDTEVLGRLTSLNAGAPAVYGVTPSLEVLEPSRRMIGVRAQGPVARAIPLRVEPTAVTLFMGRIITGGRDRIVRELRVPEYTNAKTDVLHEYRGASSDIVAVAISDSHLAAPLAAICTDGSISMWPAKPGPQMQAGNWLQTYQHQSEGELRTSPSGRYAVLTDSENTHARVSGPNGQSILQFDLESSRKILETAWSPTERYVVVYLSNRGIRPYLGQQEKGAPDQVILVDIQSRRIVADVAPGGQFSIGSIAFSADESVFVLGTLGRGSYVVDSEDGSQLGYFTEAGTVCSLNNDGTLLALVGNTVLTIHDLNSDRVICEYPAKRVRRMTFDPSGNTLYFMGEQPLGTQQLDIPTGTAVSLDQRSNLFGTLAISSDGMQLYAYEYSRLKVFSIGRVDAGPLLDISWQGLPTDPISLANTLDALVTKWREVHDG